MTTKVAEWSWLLAPVSSNMPRQALERRRRARERVRVAGLVVERVAGRGVDVGPQVVLEEVVVVRDAAVGRRRVVLVELRRRASICVPYLLQYVAALPRLREAEVAELVALRVLLAGVLAGVEQLAALVEEVRGRRSSPRPRARRAGARRAGPAGG